MTCIIVDDEPLAREGLRDLIEEVSELEICGTFSNALQAVEFLKNNAADIVFLDIQMPGLTGLDFAAQLPGQTLVIFTTAYSKYAVNSYDLDAIDYLLKPIDTNRLAKAIKKAITYKALLSNEAAKSTVEQSAADFMLIKSERRFFKVSFHDIRFIEGLKDYVIIHTRGHKLITAMNLKAIQQKITSNRFLRVSKSYLVNLEHINSFDNHSIYIDDFEVPIGDTYKKAFFDIYLNEHN